MSFSRNGDVIFAVLDYVRGIALLLRHILRSKRNFSLFQI
jgi:hypothetical protein